MRPYQRSQRPNKYNSINFKKGWNENNTFIKSTYRERNLRSYDEDNNDNDNDNEYLDDKRKEGGNKNSNKETNKQDIPLNNGLNDIGTTASPYILFRTISQDIKNGQDLINGFNQIQLPYKPKRALFLRWKDKYTVDGENEPTGFAFIEFDSDSIAQRVIDIINRYKKKEPGYILGDPNAIHLGVFQPVNTDGSTGFFRSLLGQSMMYWDESIYICEYPEHQKLENKVDNHDDNDDNGNNDEHIQYTEHKQSNDSDLKKRKRKRDNSSLASNMNKQLLTQWKRASNQLRPSMEFQQKSFADLERNACVLCYRKFSTSHEVNTHERLSELHIYNMSLNEEVERAEKIVEILKGR